MNSEKTKQKGVQKVVLVTLHLFVPIPFSSRSIRSFKVKTQNSAEPGVRGKGIASLILSIPVAN